MIFFQVEHCKENALLKRNFSWHYSFYCLLHYKDKQQDGGCRHRLYDALSKAASETGYIRSDAFNFLIEQVFLFLLLIIGPNSTLSQPIIPSVTRCYHYNLFAVRASI